MATYYWVGGDGTWDNANTTNWATSSGGAGGNGPPLSTDTVVFDSGSGTGTCTTAAGSACAVVTLNSATLGLTLGANHTMSGLFTLTLGTLSLGSSTLTCQLFSSNNNSNTRTIDFGTGSIDLTGNNLVVWSINTLTNLTVIGTPNVNLTYSGAVGTRSINGGSNGGGTALKTFNFNITGGTDIIAGTMFFVKSLNFTGFSGTLSAITSTGTVIFGNLTISSGMTLTAGTSAYSFRATSGVQQITTNGKTLDFPLDQNGGGGTVQLQDNLTMGSTRTFTLTAGTLDLNNQTLSTGLFSSSNSNVRSIAFGTGNITLTGNAATIWTTSTTTNLSILGTPVVNCTYAGAVSERTITPGALGEARAISFNISAGSDAFALSGGGGGYKNINFTGFSGTLSINSNSLIFGNFTISSGMSLSSTATGLLFSGTSGAQQITTAGKTFDFPLTFNGIGGTFAFQDALTQGSTRAFTLTNGTLQLKDGVTSTVGSFATSGTNQKYLQSTLAGTQATISQTSGTLNLQYLTVKDINATGGAKWNAVNNSFTQGNNTGWYFAAQLGKPIPAFAF